MEKNQVFRLVKYIWPHWYLLPPVLSCMISATLLSLAPPWLMGVVLIDRVILAKEASLLTWVVLGVLGSVIFRQIFDFSQRYLLALLSQRAIHQLRCDLYLHLEQLPLSYFSRTPVGDLVSRQVNDADSLEDGLQALVTEAGVHLILMLGTLALLFSLNARLTFYILPFMFLLGVTMHVFRRVVRGSSLAVRQRLGQLSTLVTETLSGIGVVKAFSMERAELSRFSGLSVNILRANLRLARLEGFYSSSVELILISGTVLVVWLAAPQVIAEQMTLGALVAYLSYLTRFYDPLKGLSRANFQIQKSVGAAERIFAVLDTAEETTEDPTGVLLPRTTGKLTFENVDFAYDPQRPVLNDFSLEIQPGEVVALVGTSGAGKTTLINLLLRFYTPTAGRILLDGVPLDTLDVQSLRSQISLVSQEPFLFSTTVRDNILYGNPQAEHSQVEQAAKNANIHDFIVTLPQGYQTLVGQRGVALSGGQRQRISLARAFLKDSPVLLLDEATTSVDSEAEALIQDALEQLTLGRTTLIIAHRLSSLHRAQRIIILENGRITEEGTHQSLLARPSLYRKLYDLQTLEQPVP
ncbi:MAG: hypothetical protein BZY80_07205 [SAR202 cluster bacterium Io17-Chloro-G2]|nr:MAG: hypothetical protein BZY80_07205 [SAR202 cluster bacterium Io17-Chloro-G2]